MFVRNKAGLRVPGFNRGGEMAPASRPYLLIAFTTHAMEDTLLKFVHAQTGVDRLLLEARSNEAYTFGQHEASRLREHVHAEQNKKRKYLGYRYNVMNTWRHRLYIDC